MIMQAVIEKKQNLNTTLVNQKASQFVELPKVNSRWEVLEHPFFTEFVLELVFILLVAGCLYALAWVSIQT